MKRRFLELLPRIAEDYYRISKIEESGYEIYSDN